VERAGCPYLRVRVRFLGTLTGFFSTTTSSSSSSSSSSSILDAFRF
jgi:hypothetical protein